MSPHKKERTPLADSRMVYEYIIFEGFMKMYGQWIFHRKELLPSFSVRQEVHNVTSSDHNYMYDMLRDNFLFLN